MLKYFYMAICPSLTVRSRASAQGWSLEIPSRDAQGLLDTHCIGDVFDTCEVLLHVECHQHISPKEWMGDVFSKRFITRLGELVCSHQMLAERTVNDKMHIFFFHFFLSALKGWGQHRHVCSKSRISEELNDNFHHTYSRQTEDINYLHWKGFKRSNYTPSFF